MKNKKQNEELQNRREFFKSAAKKALPIIGAIALASTPIFAKAAEKDPMGCQWDCSYSCQGGCMGCRNMCQGSCKDQCDTSCYLACRGTCSRSCLNGCFGMNRGL